MATAPVVTRVLTRHLSAFELLRDLAVLVALGLLASFALLFVSRVPFDNLLYETGLGYQSRVGAQADHGGGLVLGVFEGEFDLSTSSLAPGSTHGDSVNATVELYPDDRGADAARLLGGTLIAGQLCPDGVVIDEATAARFDRSVGDTVVLTWSDSPAWEDDETQIEDTEAQVRICAIGRPWHPGDSIGTQGYAIWARSAAGTLLPGLADATPSSHATFWLDETVPGATTKAQAIEAVVGQHPSWSAFVVFVACLGIGLWVVGLQRAASGLRESLAAATSIVRALGAPPAGWLVVFLGLSWATALVAAASAAALARVVILGWTGLYIAPTQIIVVALALLIVALVFTSTLGWRIARSW
nr:hypothetical protein [Propionicimonas sp.]